MPENKGVGWRKKIHSKPKELQIPKVMLDDSSAAEDPGDRRRHHVWRKTIQGSRPSTPATPTVEELEEGQTQRTDSSTPRPDAKPKLNRYTSLFSSFKEPPKGPDFSEPWDETIPAFKHYVDPELTIQSIRSHMIQFSRTPVSLEHNNGLFCIFEEYHKLRNETEHLQIELQEVRQNFQIAEARWTEEERRYVEEIRRLELLIAKGTTGVAGSVLKSHYLRSSLTISQAIEC